MHYAFSFIYFFLKLPNANVKWNSCSPVTLLPEFWQTELNKKERGDETNRGAITQHVKGRARMHTATSQF